MELHATSSTRRRNPARLGFYLPLSDKGWRGLGLARLHSLHCVPTPGFRSVPLRSAAPPFRRSGTPLLRYSSAPAFRRSSIPLRCIKQTVPQAPQTVLHSSTPRFHTSTLAHLRTFATPHLHDSTATQLHCAALHSSPTSPLHSTHYAEPNPVPASPCRGSSPSASECLVGVVYGWSY